MYKKIDINKYLIILLPIVSLIVFIWFKFSLFLYLVIVPATPFLVRIVLILNFIKISKELLTEEERDIDKGTALTLTMAGFSFSALFVLLIASQAFIKENIDLSLSVYYSAISAISLMASYSIESYKFDRKRQQFCLGFGDIGYACLLISVIILMWQINILTQVKILISLITFILWSIDFYIRIQYWYSFFLTKTQCE